MILALGVSIGAGAAVMAHGGESNLVHACVHKNSGNVRIVEADASCKKNEHALDWSIQGPVGPAGIDGVDGLNGAAGQDGVDGEKGDPGLVWRGTWDSSAEYAADDTVQYQGSSYVAVAPNSNEAPGGGSSWDVLAQKGQQGSVGPQGDPGTAPDNSAIEARMVDLETKVEDLEGLVSNFVTVPTLSIGDVELAEGNGDTTDIIFPVTLSHSSLLTITVDYSTFSSGDPYTARQGFDFTSTSGTLTFEPGETTRTISVEVIPNDVPEQNESFYVDLENPVNAVILDSQGVGTILNDDTPAFLVSSDIDCEDGSLCVFRVMIVGHLDQPATVEYSTIDNTAIAGTDYVSVSGSVTFEPGEPINQYVFVEISTIERPSATGTATFYVELSNPTNAEISEGQGTITIERD